MIAEVGGPEELKKFHSIRIVGGIFEFVLADQTPEVRNVNV